MLLPSVGRTVLRSAEAAGAFLNLTARHKKKIGMAAGKSLAEKLGLGKEGTVKAMSAS